MYASLMAADIDEELHLLRDGKTRSTTGSVVSSLYHLKDIDNADAGFFVFPDLSVRMEGNYRLKLSLFEIIGFPGMEESTFLSRSFADQGLKLRIRKEIRVRRKQSKRKESQSDSSGRQHISNKVYSKRARKGSFNHEDDSDNWSDGENDSSHMHSNISSGVSSADTWHNNSNDMNQPSKILKSDSYSSSPNVEPENIDRLAVNSRQTPIILGSEMVLPPTNRSYPTPYPPYSNNNVAQSKSMSSSVARNRPGAPGYQHQQQTQPGAPQPQWIMSPSEQPPQSSENWYHRLSEDSNVNQRENPSSDSGGDSPSTQMTNVFYPASSGSIGLNQPMDATYGARRAGPAGAARYNNYQLPPSGRSSAPETYAMPGPSTIRGVSGSPYTRYSPQQQSSPRPQAERSRHSAESYYSNIKPSKDQEHMMYREPYSMSRRQGSMSHPTQDGTVAPHEEQVSPPAPHQHAVNMPGGNLEWYDESGRYPHQGRPAGHPVQSKQGQQPQPQQQPQQYHRPPQQPQQEQHQSSMYPVSEARMYYSDVPRR
ncbi:hypothetical protein INT43_002753 [Umbelopsis isabellina]|uniref:Velvet domain-containing protein n=1 Tax=Mortierella isabellina TaxID=91625 RepID=A0A8H7Q6P5_MORIS|nr:hypothetical protein INT43_002753 [Umbelopsis isabellina]